MPTKQGTLPINGAELYVEEAGRGPALVFVHAGIADRRMWGPQVEAFAADHRVIAYDMRGYGQSPPVAGTVAHYRDLLGLLDALEVERAVLVACSLGGAVALDAALADPDRLAGLVLSGSIPFGFEMDEYPEDPPAAAAIYEAQQAGDLERANELEVAYWLDGCYQEPGRVDDSIRQLVLDMNGIALRNAASTGVSEEVLEPKAGKRLDEIKQPTLLIWGELDEPIIRLANEIQAGQMPNARLLALPGTAHLPGLDVPDAFNRLLREFLEEIDG